MKNIFYAILAIVIFYIQNGNTEDTDAKVTAEDDNALSRVRRGGLSMLRLGRGLQMLRLGKRSLPMMRLGRSSDYVPSDLDLFLYGLLYNYDKDFRDRQVPMPRYGRSLGDDAEGPEYDALSQIRPPPRLGRFKRSPQHPGGDDMESIRAVPVPRFGRLLRAEKAVPVPRIGRYLLADDGFDKRGLHMLRLGRAGLQTLRLGRALPTLRLGKRLLPTLRLGKREDDDDSQNEVDKRLLNTLRLGKREASHEEEASENVVEQAE